MNNMIGKMLDNRYELLEVIGSGGMAVVYKAKCHRLNRLVAVKVLKSDLAEDADFRRRFRDESQAVAMLSHPNIVSVYDVSRGETEYIVMELIDGITLKQYMEKRGQLNWREALHFITQIMKALSHAAASRSLTSASPALPTPPTRSRRRRSARCTTCRPSRRGATARTRARTSTPRASCSTKC